MCILTLQRRRSKSGKRIIDLIIKCVYSNAVKDDDSHAFSFENTKWAKMARAALSRRAITDRGVLVCCLAAKRATFGPYRPLIDGPLRRAKNGPIQMRRPNASLLELLQLTKMLHEFITKK